MTASSRAAPSADAASDAAASLREAPLARLVVRADGDGIAAAGVLARALRAIGVPVQLATTASRNERSARASAGDPDATTVAIGPATGADVPIDGTAEPATATAVRIARALDVEPDAALALAGVIAAGEHPADATPEVYERATGEGLERRPGLGLATTDVVDGLAHATSVHADFSGDPESTAAALSAAGIDDPASLDADALGEKDRRTVASLLAIAGTEHDPPEQAGEIVARQLRPHTGLGPAPSLEGYADLLGTVAIAAPGIAAAHAMGGLDLDAVRAPWREASEAVHRQLTEADPARYDGVAVYDAGEAPVALLATLARDATSPEPVALVIGEAKMGIAARSADATALAEAIAGVTDGNVELGARFATVGVAAGVEESAVVDAVRGAR